MKREAGETQTGFPFFLPDGKRFLMYVTANQPTIQLATLGSQARSVVVDAADGAALMARTPGGKSYLLFVYHGFAGAGVRRSSWRGPRFAERARHRHRDGGQPTAESRSWRVWRCLAYQTGGVAAVNPLIWVNRSGIEVGRLTKGSVGQRSTMSSDGARILGSKFDVGTSGLWVTDLRRGASTRITFSGSAFDGVWSPDGSKVAYRRVGAQGVVVAGADGSGERRVADPVIRLWDGLRMVERCSRPFRADSL